MKFIAPEVEVLKFNVADVLTTSGDEPVAPTKDTSQKEYLASIMGMPCANNASDNSYDDCL